jgi:hypothetical protein
MRANDAFEKSQRGFFSTLFHGRDGADQQPFFRCNRSTCPTFQPRRRLFGSLKRFRKPFPSRGNFAACANLVNVARVDMRPVLVLSIGQTLRFLTRAEIRLIPVLSIAQTLSLPVLADMRLIPFVPVVRTLSLPVLTKRRNIPPLSIVETLRLPVLTDVRLILILPIVRTVRLPVLAVIRDIPYLAIVMKVSSRSNKCVSLVVELDFCIEMPVQKSGNQHHLLKREKS